MKKLLALTLAIMMLIPLVACGEDPKPPVGGGTDAPGTETGGDDTDPPAGDEGGDDWVYVPDLEAKRAGAVGVGVETGSAYFDNLKVIDKASKRTLHLEELEGEMPALTHGIGSADDWSIGVDPVEEDEEEPNHALTYTGETSMAYFGDPKWNFYQFSVRVYPVDEATVINIYFLVTDEKNYHVLSINEDGEYADCYQVVNGEKTSVAAKVYCPIPAGEWSSIGVTVERETVEVYVAGSHRFSLYDPEFTYSVSLSPKATVEAPYCSSWESADSLNDGIVGSATYNGGETHYGSWSMASVTETITFTWEEAITTDAVGMFFWNDTADRASWLASGGINSPVAWTVQYLNDAGEYVDVTGATESPVANDVMNVMWFDEVTTTALQFTLIKFTADEDATYGFSAYDEYEGDAEAEDAPTDPYSRGMGLYEIEVYPSGTVARPE